MEEVTPVKVTHSIPLFWGSVEVLELHQDCVYEWRYLDDKGKLLYRSSFMYGNPPSALRDALITITGEPSCSGSQT